MSRLDVIDAIMRLNNHLQRFGIGCFAEGVVGLKDVGQLESVRDELRCINAFGLYRLEQHEDGERVHQPGGDSHVVRPQPLQVCRSACMSPW